jgi:hypothetical protein
VIGRDGLVVSPLKLFETNLNQKEEEKEEKEDRPLQSIAMIRRLTKVAKKDNKDYPKLSTCVVKRLRS